MQNTTLPFGHTYITVLRQQLISEKKGPTSRIGLLSKKRIF